MSLNKFLEEHLNKKRGEMEAHPEPPPNPKYDPNLFNVGKIYGGFILLATPFNFYFADYTWIMGYISPVLGLFLGLYLFYTPHYRFTTPVFDFTRISAFVALMVLIAALIFTSAEPESPTLFFLLFVPIALLLFYETFFNPNVRWRKWGDWG